MTYTEAVRFLGGGRSKQDRPYDHNTRVQRRDESTIALKLHATDILTWHADGRTVLDSGGWRTVTTKDRMNKALEGYRVYSNKGVLFLANGKDAWPFEDGITMHPDGSVTGAGPDPRETVRVRKAVRRFAKRFIDRMRAGKLSSPGPGDCFYCLMRDQDGRSMGSLGGVRSERNHVLSHVEEKYYVPSLLERFRREGKVSRVEDWTITAAWIADKADHPQFEEAKKLLASPLSNDKYLARRFGSWLLRVCGEVA